MHWNPQFVRCSPGGSTHTPFGLPKEVRRLRHLDPADAAPFVAKPTQSCVQVAHAPAVFCERSLVRRAGRKFRRQRLIRLKTLPDSDHSVACNGGELPVSMWRERLDFSAF